MKNALIPNEKQIKADVKKYGLSSISKAKGAVEDSILCGLALLKLKEITPHGQWESNFKSAIDGVFGMRHGQKLMQIAAKKELLLVAPKDEVLTINDAIEFVSNATPEQIAEAERIKAERIAAEEQAKADKAAKAAELEAKKAEEQIIKHVQTKEPEIIEGDFTEVKQAYEPEETIEQVLTEANEILQADNQELIKEIDSVTKILESNDQVAAALAEAKKYRELNRVLNERVTGLQNEKNEAIRSVKHWRNRAEKAERELAAIKAAA